MRIIVLNDHGAVNGGAAQVAISSLNALAEAGVDVTYVSSIGPIDPVINQNLVKVVNFGLHGLLSNPSRIHAAVSGIWNFTTAARFEDVLADYDQKNTIIHLHTWMYSLSSSVVHVAIKRGFKVVCTLHDYFSICPNGGLYSYSRQRHCKLAPMSLACVFNNCDSRSYSYKLWRVARQVVQNKFGNFPNGLKFFITVSDYSESLMRPWLPLTASYFRVRNPIDVGKDIPSAANENEAFTFIGRLSPEKGGVVFAAAARLAGVRSIFVGSGEEEKNIRVVNPSAEFLGWQDRVGVINAIKSSRAIVFPSLWHETQGMVVLEAAAQGVPAIVSDGCAARDFVIHGETGLLFKAGDIDDLARMLTILKNDPDMAMRLGKTAYARYWEKPCTPANHVKELIECYKEILA